MLDVTNVLNVSKYLNMLFYSLGKCICILIVLSSQNKIFL